MRKFRYHSEYHQENIKSEQVDSELIRRLMRYLRPYLFWVIAAVILLVSAKILEAAVPLGLGLLTQKILSGDRTESGQLSVITRGSLWLFLCLAGSFVFESVSVVVKNWIGQNALYRLRLEIFSHIQSLPVRYFDRHAVGRLMTRTIHDVEQINLMFTDSIIPLIGSLFLFLAVFSGIFWMDWRLGMVIVCLMPALWWIADHFRVNQKKCYNRIRSIVSVMNTFVQEHLMGQATLRLFGVQNRQTEKFERINDDYKTAYMESLHHFSFLFASIDFLQNLALIASFVILVVFSAPHTPFQAGAFFTFSLYIMMLFRPIADLSERYNLLQSAVAAAKKIFHVLDEVKEQDEEQGRPLYDVDSIVFEDVWFGYDPGVWVLKGLSFTVNKGDTVAFVGMTGAGKTTIFSLLLRFYEIEKGRILINGCDIRQYSRKRLREAFGVVLQDPVIFSDTVAENISMGNAKITTERIAEAGEYVNLDPYVRRFPEGYDHLLKEQGRDLSAGEKQLISLARAVAHDRSLLMLDEATSNIDAMSERSIQNALKRIMGEKTALIIAHRLSTVRHAKKIVVVHQGVACKQGTHDQLLRSGGLYEKLYRIQFMEGNKT